MDFLHLWCWRAARHLLPWLARSKSIASFSSGNPPTLVNGTKATFALPEFFGCLHLHYCVSQLPHHSFPIFPFALLPWASQPSQSNHASLQLPESARHDASPAQEQLLPFMTYFMCPISFLFCCSPAHSFCPLCTLLSLILMGMFLFYWTAPLCGLGPGFHVASGTEFFHIPWLT